MSLHAKYTEEDKAVALAAYAANENNLTKTAAFCRIPKQTIHRWVKGEAINQAVSRKRDIKKGQIADECERLAWKLLSGIDNEEKIAETPVNLLSVSFGTLIDKMRLLRGESTQTVDVNDQRDALYQKWASFTAANPAETIPEQPE